ncbi:hydrogenase-1 operon protein HyaF [Roseiarcus fermentans]|uniref:Hydrogenase-1 operon protein HyaF n=1 Tax=Roseiarcus fermentans TaxID=1473586 RepID=A0A366F9C2_9HYPH|nr:hydrogenase expression/formation protein [Roseiarcus fermentans]RBP11227.1 hydrogenase-1 operon protein HyaF [Roseiarcus fermentans]
MKAAFWIAPEGDDNAVALTPVGPAPEALTARPAFLGTPAADALIRRCARTAALLPQLADALAAQRAGGRNRLFDITEVGEDDRRLIGEALGEGEVGGVALMPQGVTAQIAETLFAGLWRVRFSDGEGRAVADYLEVGAIPEAVREAARAAAPELMIGAPPDGAMNVMPVLAEIRERMAAWAPGAPAHVVTLSLLPMSPEDVAFLQATLGEGPVRLVSRGYGNCRAIATGARGVWSVQYTNASDAVVLDTLEIGDVPAVALAADEDFADSSLRLRAIEDAYFR